MNQALKERLEQLKLMPADMSGAMRLQLEGGIEVRAVTHPFFWPSAHQITLSLVPKICLNTFKKR